MVVMEAVRGFACRTRTFRTINVSFRFREEFTMADINTALGIDASDDNL